VDVLDLFVGIFESFGLPKSTAMIYGVLYCAADPLTQEDIGTKLGISSGSASQGLKLLTSLGAVHRQSPVGSRVSLYNAERSMRRLLGYFIDAQLRPKLKSGRGRLEEIAEGLPADASLAHERVESLLNWQRKADKALPLVSKLFGK
jgi:DNA-binding transcriptional regulator GbsR (MarR family)